MNREHLYVGFLIVLLIAGIAFVALFAHGQAAPEDSLLMPLPEPKSSSRIVIGGALIIRVEDKDGKMMVNVAKDGAVTYGDGYKATAAAREFWKTMAHYYPVVCQPEAKSAPK